MGLGSLFLIPKVWCPGAVDLGRIRRQQVLLRALAAQFRAFRPGALVGLTVPTVPALRRGEEVLLPVQPATRQTVARFLGRPGPAHPAASASTGPAPRPAWDPRPC